MKKYTYTIIIFLFSYTFLLSFDNEQVVVSTFNETDVYKVYKVVYEDGITIDKYKDMFVNINPNDYYILGITTYNNYSFNVKDSISKIELSKGSYMEVLDEYISKYKDILYLNNLEDDISSLYRGGFYIESIDIRCKEYVFLSIKNKM